MLERVTELDNARNIQSLTGLRFYAALAVVLYHVTYALLRETPVAMFFSAGAVGVSFFFVLSGFVLTWSRSDSVGTKNFYRNRFARIYPTHLLTWAIALILVAFSIIEPVTPIVALSSLVLLQAWVPFQEFYFSLNGPSWSLSVEAFFYAVFPFLVRRLANFNQRSLVWMAGVLFVLAVVVSVALHYVFRGGPTVGLLYVNPAYRLWEFVLGILLALSMKRGWRVRAPLPVTVAVTVAMFGAVSMLGTAISMHLGPFGSLSIDSLPTDLASLVMVPFFGILIASAVSTELRGGASHFAGPRLVKLGKWSFALYMIHILILATAEKFVPSNASLVERSLVAGGVVVSAVVTSAVVYRFFESPIEKRLRSPRSRARVD